MLPAHLRNLARVGAEVTLEVAAPVTIASVLDVLEARYPMLCGTIRDHDTLHRRAFIRYFACEEDLSHDPPDTPLSANTLDSSSCAPAHASPICAGSAVCS